MADINEINLSLGEQLFLPVGRIINFNGNIVTVTKPNGDIVSETVVTDEQKVNPNQNIGETVNSPVLAPKNPVIPIQPTEPTNPVTPKEPEVPEGLI